MIAKQGIIFDYSALRHSNQGDSGLPPLSGVARMTVFFGNFLIFVSILGFLATTGPTLFYEASFQIKKVRGVEYKILEDTSSKTKPALSSRPTPKGYLSTQSSFDRNDTLVKTLTPKDTSFSILIPKLGINEKVFANVDASNENEYLSALKQGAAHAKGTFFPGQNGNVYIFAHSGQNFWDGIALNNIFYLLKDLKPKDEIVIFFNNKRHNYEVVSSKIVSPSDVSYITSAKTNEETLILQTCWPPLTTWNRLLVFAKPSNDRKSLY